MHGVVGRGQQADCRQDLLLARPVTHPIICEVCFADSWARSVTGPEIPVSACSYPSLLAFCGGDEGNVVRFSGQMKAGPIRKFLEQFADGKKCRQSKWALKAW